MKKLVLGILAFAMLLAGCSIKKAGENEAGNAKGDIVLKVGDVEVKREFVEYFEGVFAGGVEGEVSEPAKQKAMEAVKMYAEFNALGIAMKLDAEQEYKTLVEDVTSSVGSIEKLKEELDITTELFDFVMYGDAYRNLMMDICMEESGISEEAIDVYFNENYWRAKHLLLTTEGKTEEEQSKIKAQAEDLYNQVKNGANFDKLIEQYNEDPGVSTNPDGYVFTEGTMVQEFEDGVKNIEIGEYNLVKTSYGYHVVQRLALDETPKKFEEYKSEYAGEIEQKLLSDNFNKFVDDKIKEYDIKTTDNTIAK